MAVVRVDCLCECEGCQKRFGVELPLDAFELEPTDSLGDPVQIDFDVLVREEVLAGNGCYYTWGVRGKQTVDRLSLSYQPTIQAELLLCDECSKKCDDYHDEDRALRLDEVNRAILGLKPLE